MDGPFPEQLVPDWKAFLFCDKPLGDTRDRSLEELFSAPVLFPLQRRNEMEWMHRRGQSIGAKCFYEIGADKGGGLWAWLTHVPTTTHAIACEIRGTPYKELFEAAFPKVKFLWLERSSYDTDTVDGVHRWLHKHSITIDALFIDGDKTKFDVDFELYYPHMTSKGIAFFHDVQDVAPLEGYNRVLSAHREFEHVEYINTRESQHAAARERQGVPATTSYEHWLRHWNGASCGVGAVFLK